ncbi:hypothetical protein ILUMI_24028 [Ignelater luminosus]|uniref:Uncharacterized protein n=1 Tax=Ignelater luminosus TaxID=2038154 RepID=A0A8K0FZ47_IGNLU|nr:hypothetical protein ILUMI_24028 [Ignelater luminosus]
MVYLLTNETVDNTTATFRSSLGVGGGPRRPLAKHGGGSSRGWPPRFHRTAGQQYSHKSRDRWTSGDSPCRRGAARGPGLDSLGSCDCLIFQSLGKDTHVGTLSTEVPTITSTLMSASTLKSTGNYSPIPQPQQIVALYIGKTYLISAYANKKLGL